METKNKAVVKKLIAAVQLLLILCGFFTILNLVKTAICLLVICLIIVLMIPDNHGG
jgi:hypothetical protein